MDLRPNMRKTSVGLEEGGVVCEDACLEALGGSRGRTRLS